MGNEGRAETYRTCVGFCPVCRGIRAYAVADIREVPHFYNISMGKGDTIEYVGQCCQCGLDQVLDRATYDMIVLGYTGNIESLISSSYPRFVLYTLIVLL